jgi:hypothetical protein
MNSRYYPYATDSNEREALAYWFAAISIALAYLFNLTAAALKLEFPWWLVLPSPMALYLFVRWVFSRFLWRWQPLHALGIVKIPDLNGEYKGHLWTSHDKHADRHPCDFTVSQTWTSMSVHGRFAQSRSFNMVSGISVEGTDAPRLSYEYWNEPASGAVEGMAPHRGTIWFDIRQTEIGIQLDGEYYTGRGRGTSGRIQLRRTKSTS